jgi:amidase
MGTGELTRATARGLARSIAGREVSVGEVVEAHLRRIEEINGTINAIVQVDAERALVRARESDAALARGVSAGDRCTGSRSPSRTIFRRLGFRWRSAFASAPR